MPDSWRRVLFPLVSFFFLTFHPPPSLSSLPPSLSPSLSIFNYKPSYFLWIIDTQTLDPGESAIGTDAHIYTHRDKLIHVYTHRGINILCTEQRQ